jgi:hypothetical protein
MKDVNDIDLIDNYTPDDPYGLIKPDIEVFEDHE